jgi:hypothetical protein
MTAVLHIRRHVDNKPVYGGRVVGPKHGALGSEYAESWNFRVGP